MSNDNSDESADDGLSFWEEAAIEAVDRALEEAELDEVSGTIIIQDSSGDDRMNFSCRSIEELQQALEGIYDEQWYGNVPFESGVAVFEGDASGYVMDVIEREDIVAFFEQLGEEPEADLIISATDLLKTGNTKIIRVDVADINDELIKYLATHPEKMHDLHPRQFEELVAELFRSKGYDVTLTPRTRDGGLDVCAVRRNELGTILIVIECKRYATTNKVGVEIVRGLYGVVEAQRATKGIVATTSYFSKDAKKFYNDLRSRLALTDYDELCRMLREWKLNRGYPS